MIEKGFDFDNYNKNRKKSALNADFLI